MDSFEVYDRRNNIPAKLKSPYLTLDNRQTIMHSVEAIKCQSSWPIVWNRCRMDTGGRRSQNFQAFIHQYKTNAALWRKQAFATTSRTNYNNIVASFQDSPRLINQILSNYPLPKGPNGDIRFLNQTKMLFKPNEKYDEQRNHGMVVKLKLPGQKATKLVYQTIFQQSYQVGCNLPPNKDKVRTKVAYAQMFFNIATFDGLQLKLADASRCIKTFKYVWNNYLRMTGLMPDVITQKQFTNDILHKTKQDTFSNVQMNIFKNRFQVFYGGAWRRTNKLTLIPEKNKPDYPKDLNFYGMIYVLMQRSPDLFQLIPFLVLPYYGMKAYYFAEGINFNHISYLAHKMIQQSNNKAFNACLFITNLSGCLLLNAKSTFFTSMLSPLDLVASRSNLIEQYTFALTCRYHSGGLYAAQEGSYIKLTVPNILLTLDSALANSTPQSFPPLKNVLLPTVPEQYYGQTTYYKRDVENRYKFIITQCPLTSQFFGRTNIIGPVQYYLNDATNVDNYFFQIEADKKTGQRIRRLNGEMMKQTKKIAALFPDLYQQYATKGFNRLNKVITMPDGRQILQYTTKHISPKYVPRSVVSQLIRKKNPQGGYDVRRYYPSYGYAQGEGWSEWQSQSLKEPRRTKPIRKNPILDSNLFDYKKKNKPIRWEMKLEEVQGIPQMQQIVQQMQEIPQEQQIVRKYGAPTLYNPSRPIEYDRMSFRTSRRPNRIYSESIDFFGTPQQKQIEQWPLNGNNGNNLTRSLVEETNPYKMEYRIPPVRNIQFGQRSSAMESGPQSRSSRVSEQSLLSINKAVPISLNIPGRVESLKSDSVASRQNAGLKENQPERNQPMSIDQFPPFQYQFSDYSIPSIQSIRSSKATNKISQILSSLKASVQNQSRNFNNPSSLESSLVNSSSNSSSSYPSSSNSSSSNSSSSYPSSSNSSSSYPSSSNSSSSHPSSSSSLSNNPPPNNPSTNFFQSSYSLPQSPFQSLNSSRVSNKPIQKPLNESIVQQFDVNNFPGINMRKSRLASSIASSQNSALLDKFLESHRIYQQGSLRGSGPSLSNKSGIIESNIYQMGQQVPFSQVSRASALQMQPSLKQSIVRQFDANRLPSSRNSLRNSISSRNSRQQIPYSQSSNRSRAQSLLSNPFTFKAQSVRSNPFSSRAQSIKSSRIQSESNMSSQNLAPSRVSIESQTSKQDQQYMSKLWNQYKKQSKPMEVSLIDDVLPSYERKGVQIEELPRSIDLLKMTEPQESTFDKTMLSLMGGAKQNNNKQPENWRDAYRQGQQYRNLERITSLSGGVDLRSGRNNNLKKQIQSNVKMFDDIYQTGLYEMEQLRQEYNKKRQTLLDQIADIQAQISDKQKKTGYDIREYNALQNKIFQSQTRMGKSVINQFKELFEQKKLIKQQLTDLYEQFTSKQAALSEDITKDLDKISEKVTSLDPLYRKIFGQSIRQDSAILNSKYMKQYDLIKNY